MHLNHVILYIQYTISPILRELPDSGVRLRRRSISLISSQITSNIFQHIHSIYTLLIQVLSSIITVQFHHGVTKLIYADNSHSPFSYPKRRPSSLTSPALLLERDTRWPHLARSHSGDQSDRFPWACDVSCSHASQCFPMTTNLAPDTP